MRQLLLLLLLSVFTKGLTVAQSLSNGTFSSFGINTESCTAVGGETVISPINEQMTLNSGFIEVLLINKSENPLPTPEIVDITENSAIVRWQKIEGATSYKLNLYDKEQIHLLATYELDENGKLKSSTQELSFNLTDLVASTEYHIETIAYKYLDIINLQTIILETLSPTGIESFDNINLSVNENVVIIRTDRQLSVDIINIHGQTITHKNIDMQYSQSLSSGIYIVVLKNQRFQKTFKIMIK
ncbi:T9SS type A sorting domain-containing protein [Parabacteroides sp. AF18-52]|uniref:T9SS type A sorting domain-containing protein n=1 Tax=Parabacteroides TaxID=375288 RepID=UPI0013152DA6|nr:T9SS type A sorting domain-containing protein [Parabacteroides sp. AF18-52]